MIIYNLSSNFSEKYLFNDVVKNPNLKAIISNSGKLNFDGLTMSLNFNSGSKPFVILVDSMMIKELL